MRLTLIQAGVGRRMGQKYIRGWQMEPLPLAAIAGLTPPGVRIAFYDDRMEAIPYDEPSDLVAISVETYTAKRAYQIASEYRRRGVPVVMGGFHATLCPEEVSQYAEAVVIGEAENQWIQVLNDAGQGKLQPYYRSEHRPSLAGLRPDRTIYEGKRYVPIALVEAARGCQHACEFCAVQTFSNSQHRERPVEEVVADIESMKGRPFFFVDDNFAMNRRYAQELLHALIPLKIRWVSQTSISAAHDEELLRLMAASGCQGVLIGLESLSPGNLVSMNKGFNLMRGGFEQALTNLRRHRIRIYATFVFGYDGDTERSFAETLEFARKQRFFVAAFNHLMPFPGTPLYRRLEHEGRLLYEKWWLEDNYSFYMVPFQPAHMSPTVLERKCIEARVAYYEWSSIWKRAGNPANRTNPLIWLGYYVINAVFRKEVLQRMHYPLGDEAWQGELIKVREEPLPMPSGDRAE